MNFFRKRIVEVGQRVFVYRNLHNNNYSMRAMEGKYKGKVVAHAEEIWLLNAKFVVSEKGRKRVLKTKQKNVHAGIIGTWFIPEYQQKTQGVYVTYNPYFYSSFVEKETKKIVLQAKMVYLSKEGVCTY